jgi:hypothetical protein
MQVPGIWSAKLITKKEKSGEPVQYGPLPKVEVPDPLENLVKGTMGPNDWYRPNGVVEIREEKIQFLGS